MSSTVYNSSQIHLIQSTINYGQFRFDPTNRAINPDHLEKLYDAIKKKNLLKEFPILVTEDGTVLDGQHRLKAAEAIGTPIYFIVTGDMSVDDVSETNAAVRRWSTADWLDVWCKRGNQEYIKLQEFMRQYPFIKIGNAVNLCTYGNRANLQGDFKSGKYKCNDLEFAREVANAVLDFAPYVAFYKDPRFIYAVNNLMEHAEYDHSRMMAKMAYLSKKVVKCPDVETYMVMFTEIYNYRARGESQVRFAKISANARERRHERKGWVANRVK